MLFDQFDKDRSGSIEGGELQRLLQLLEISTEDCGRVMRALDRDGDGSLSFDEFYAWWELGLKVRSLPRMPNPHTTHGFESRSGNSVR